MVDKLKQGVLGAEELNQSSPVSDGQYRVVFYCLDLFGQRSHALTRHQIPEEFHFALSEHALASSLSKITTKRIHNRFNEHINRLRLSMRFYTLTLDNAGDFDLYMTQLLPLTRNSQSLPCCLTFTVPLTWSGTKDFQPR